jgi:acetyl-CoA acyltransferase
VPQGISAELIADKWGLTREELDEFGLRSQQYAARATKEGRFEREILPVLDGEGILMTTDEGIRESTLEKLASLKPSFKEDGKVTAANSSQITDGAAALLIMSEEKAAALGLTPRARFVQFALAADDPRLMLTAPIPATEKVLERAGMSLDQMDLIEINEAFASVILAWAKEHHPDMEEVNVNGGAIAIGHPLGCSGARLMTTLLSELERTGGRYGLQTMCEGGGMANATIIERLG